MNLLRGLKPETIEALAGLWTNKNFKILVKVLRLTQDKWAKDCLMASLDKIPRLQGEAAGISIVIKVVQQAFEKLNKQ